jgi:hypothetical protein
VLLRTSRVFVLDACDGLEALLDEPDAVRDLEQRGGLLVPDGSCLERCFLSEPHLLEMGFHPLHRVVVQARAVMELGVQPLFALLAHGREVSADTSGADGHRLEVCGVSRPHVPRREDGGHRFLGAG